MSEQRLVQSVQRLANALARLERQCASENDVSVSQLRVLIHLADANGGMRISDLAADQGLAVSTMTRNLGLLSEKGSTRTLSSGVPSGSVNFTTTLWKSILPSLPEVE